jgi:hypothetical protein
VGERSFQFRMIGQAATQLLRRFTRAQDGAIAVVFAVLLLPMIIGVGISIDYIRAYNAHSEMQSELDVALIAAIKSVGKFTGKASEQKLEVVIKDWFATQTQVTDYKIADVIVDASNSTITATAIAKIPTTLLRVAGIDYVDVSVVSQIAGPSTSFLDVYVVLDKSASMMLAATEAGQKAMRANVGCEFACHNGDPHTVNGKKYASNYAFSLDASIKLRSDVMLDAVDRVLDSIRAADPSSNHIRVGLYRLSDTTLEVLAPTSSMPKVATTLHSSAGSLSSASSTESTFFDVALPKLAALVGTNGTGKSASRPLKLVMMITDGVQSTRPWVFGASARVSPFNPAWCDGVKSKGITFATVYTTYLPITPDGGYNVTVGNTMASSGFSSIWGGTMQRGVGGSVTRRDYLPYAIGECATSGAYFMQATDAGEIEGSLDTLFERFMRSVRLTK